MSPFRPAWRAPASLVDRPSAARKRCSTSGHSDSTNSPRTQLTCTNDRLEEAQLGGTSHPRTDSWAGRRRGPSTREVRGYPGMIARPSGAVGHSRHPLSPTEPQDHSSALTSVCFSTRSIASGALSGG